MLLHIVVVVVDNIAAFVVGIRVPAMNDRVILNSYDVEMDIVAAVAVAVGSSFLAY